MNNGENKETNLQEEFEKINAKLKEKENITLPEGLSPENMAQKLECIAQTGVPKVSKKRSRRKIRRYIISSVATAAAFAIIVTSAFVIKPWEKDEPLQPVAPEASAEDYTEIENMFSDYSVKYQQYLAAQRKDDVIDFFTGGFFGYKAESEIILEDAMDMGGAVNGSAAPGASANTVVRSTTTTNKEYGKTNEQVAGVSEADIIKNDGKYLYVVSPPMLIGEIFGTVLMM